MYDLMVLFPQVDTRRSSGGAPARGYTPGHGEMGPEGAGGGELLECSALIKLPTAVPHGRRINGAHSGGSSASPAGRDFWAGHATWRDYYAMFRQERVESRVAIRERGSGEIPILTNPAC